MQTTSHALRLKRLGIAAYKEMVIYIRQDSYICRAEGFEAQSRINVRVGDKSAIATINMITSDLLKPDEASLSEHAWNMLGAREGELVYLAHPAPLNSMEHIRAKLYGQRLDDHAMSEVIHDVVAGRLADIQIAAFLSACVSRCLDVDEVTCLTRAMLEVGQRIVWSGEGKMTPALIVDKHCIGGVPGYRTTPIVVSIVAAYGLIIPKTSSRAITSSAGTADTMETLAPVALTLEHMKRVVEKEHGCIAWGGVAALSPADDIMIRIERSLNLDCQGQMVASVLSKKIAAGSTHVLIDIPIGPTAKIRSTERAESLKSLLEQVARKMGLQIKIIFTDGTKPVGRGIGPALEAYDVLAVLQNRKDAPQDLRARALLLAGEILEFSPQVKPGTGLGLAEEILNSGKAWQKFQAICAAQGGMRTPPRAQYTYVHIAEAAGAGVGGNSGDVCPGCVVGIGGGVVATIDNRRLALLAKLAGAPHDKAAGVYLHVNVGDKVEAGQPLLTVHAESPGELDYAVNFLKSGSNTIVCVSA